MGLGILIGGHHFGSFEPHIIPIRNYSYVILYRYTHMII